MQPIKACGTTVRSIGIEHEEGGHRNASVGHMLVGLAGAETTIQQNEVTMDPDSIAHHQEDQHIEGPSMEIDLVSSVPSEPTSKRQTAVRQSTEEGAGPATPSGLSRTDLERRNTHDHVKEVKAPLRYEDGLTEVDDPMSLDSVHCHRPSITAQHEEADSPSAVGSEGPPSSSARRPVHTPQQQQHHQHALAQGEQSLIRQHQPQQLSKHRKGPSNVSDSSSERARRQARIEALGKEADAMAIASQSLLQSNGWSHTSNKNLSENVPQATMSPAQCEATLAAKQETRVKQSTKIIAQYPHLYRILTLYDEEVPNKDDTKRYSEFASLYRTLKIHGDALTAREDDVDVLEWDLS